VTQVLRIRDYYHAHHGFDIPILDLRKLAVKPADAFIRAGDRIDLPGDPKGYAAVSLGHRSAFVGLPNIERIYGADYDRAETRKHHNAERHEYLVSRSVLDADAVIHVPKLKVHKKVGITINAKGMVGINGDKNWIAHYRVGSPEEGGDEFPDSEPLGGRTRARLIRLAIDHLLTPGSRWRETTFNVLKRAYKLSRPLRELASKHPELRGGDQLLHGGNWYGNDTAWRMTVDLARTVLFCGSDGTLMPTPQRTFLSIVDGIVAGERAGPLEPDPRQAGVLIAGDNLLAVDLVCARLMGFDWRRIRFLQWLVEESPDSLGVQDPTTVAIESNVSEWRDLMVDATAPDLRFAPHPGWVGHIEVRPPSVTSRAVSSV
jgi:hypothetical protein